jgi:huntingtin
LLENPKNFGGYAGLDVSSLTNEELDQTVSVRFQTTFLPVSEGKNQSLEFAPEAYNYNTLEDDDPRNLIFLCTSQGLAVQQDGEGAKKLFHHCKEEGGGTKRFWLEAESTSHKVGGEQKETKEEKQDAITRGKATASVIGVKEMGTRFNCLMTIQVPLKQKRRSVERSVGLLGCSFGVESSLDSLSSCGFGEESSCDLGAELMFEAQTFSKKAVKAKGRSRGGRSSSLFRKITGKSSAARVSRGTAVDEAHWNGLKVQNPERNDSECITCTIVMYYTVSGGVPSEEDVVSAVDDLESLYQSLENGNLADEKFDFMKDELKVKDVVDIAEKVVTQPPISGSSFPARLSSIFSFGR